MSGIKGFYTMPHPPIILPEIGGERASEVKATIESCKKIAKEVKDIKPQTIILVSPHGPLFSDAIAIYVQDNIKGDMGKFGVPDLKMELDIDLKLSKKIVDIAFDEGIQMAVLDEHSAKAYDLNVELDHGAFVPLYFIREELKDFNFVHITYGLLSKLELYRFGKAIESAVEQLSIDAVFIGSGDLSHRLKEDGPYKYNERGKEFDQTLIELLKDGKMNEIFNMDEELIEAAGECGLKTYYIMMGAMGNQTFKGNLLSYEGIFGVGYMVMDFELKDSSKDLFEELKDAMDKNKKELSKREDAYIRLARLAIETWVKENREITVPQELKEKIKRARFGTFVSIKKCGRLRGCIGTIYPTTDDISQEIINNAISAASRDQRFYPIRKEELDELKISVDVIKDIEDCDVKDLDPQKYGLIVSSGLKKGLLLPRLEGIDTVDKQLEISLQKAGILEGEDYKIERFKVIRHEVRR